MEKIFFDGDTVRKFYRFFRHKKPTEIRVFDAEKYPHGKSVLVNNEEDFVEKCRFYCEEEKVSVYIGARDRSARGDANVTSSRFIFFEIDEHGENKLEERDKILKFLEDSGISVTMQGMSGGGWHFYIMHEHVDFTDSDMAFRYKEESLNSFKKILQNQGFDIDGAVFNLERVTRVLGTYNYKRDKISTIDFIDTGVNAQKNTENLVKMVIKYKDIVGNVVNGANKEIIYNPDDDDEIKEIKSKWVSPGREKMALAVAGYLRKTKKLGLTRALEIVKKICIDCEDEEIESRLTAVRRTYDLDETKVLGIKGLKEMGVETDPEVLAGKEKIELPGDDSLISWFAYNLGNVMAEKKNIFYRQDLRQVVELSDIKNEKGEITHTGFIQVTPGRFTSMIEKYFSPWIWKTGRSGQKYEVKRSVTKNDASLALESEMFQEQLPAINRIFTTQIPILLGEDLTFPGCGYDKRFNSWVTPDAAKINNLEMSVEEAKGILHSVFKEFCFESEQDYTNALAALLTPFIKGIFKTGFNTRAPVFCYEANRERSGKDYLAGITGIVYEGHALEESPISSGEYRSSGNNDELRKKIISCMISGKRYFHSSNNKGHINSAVFEAVTTARKYTDRLLGKNVEVAFENEMNFSFSGNTGMTMTPDLYNRTIFIKLFLEIENANDRKFKNPILHDWVLQNRNEILSALFALVRNWFDKGCLEGSVPFASFPEWARVCGGIMEAADYGNPCGRLKERTGVAMDSETEDMKELFETCFEEYPNNPIDKHTIKEILIKNNIMSYIKWDDRSSQTKFAIKLNKFKGRILSDIKMTVEDDTARPARWRYIFAKKTAEPRKEWKF